MKCELFEGVLVRLSMIDPDLYSANAERWARNSEFLRLASSSVAIPYSVRQITEWYEKYFLEPAPNEYHFTIHTRDVGRLVGDIELDGISWPNRECYVGISIGDPEDWGKGYGTDAMRIILKYAFTELNLRHVSLNTFEYNPRAIRSYEKAGFCHEGRVRKYLNRNGRRWDLLYMGILYEEWKACENA